MTTKHIFISCIAVTAGLCGFAAFAHVGGKDGDLSTKGIHVSDFQELSVAVPCTISYVQDANSPTITITASEKAWDILKVSSEDGKAMIKTKNNRWPDLDPLEIKVNSSSLSKLSCAGSVDFTSSSIEAKSFTASLSGRGTISIGKITTEAFDTSISGSGDLEASGTFGVTSVKVAGSGDVDLDGEFGDVTLSISGSGDMNLSGKAGDVNAKISGSGDIDLTKLECGHISSKVSGSGSIQN